MTTPRRPNAILQDKVVLTRDVTTAISATTTQLLGTMTRDYLIDRFELEVPGGYSADASNYYVITLQAGATVLATWSTQTGQQGALTDLVFGSAALAVPAVGAANDVLSIVYTKHASATNLPADTRLVAHCHQL